MKVLYGLWNYPQLSETYIQYEIDFAKAQGVEVAVWSQTVRSSFETGVQVFRGVLADALNAFRPDVLHVHYLKAAEQFLPQVPLSLPMTVRGHSFDWDPALAGKLAAEPRVHRLFVFPHFAAQVGHPKVIPLPVAIDGGLFPPSIKTPGTVLRTSAGRPDKGLTDFFETARLLSSKLSQGLGYHFKLAVAEAGGPGGGKPFVDSLVQPALDSGVELHIDLPWPGVRRLMSETSVYMDTSDPAGHPFGMPVSIAEALSTGSYVVVRRTDAAADYLGGAGALYSSPQEAADLIRSHIPAAETAAKAMARGMTFHAERVLKPLVDCWRTLARHTERHQVSKPSP